MTVSANMFSKAVNENKERLGLIGFVGPSVELGSSGSGNPALFERGGGHDGADQGRVLGTGVPLCTQLLIKLTRPRCSWRTVSLSIGEGTSVGNGQPAEASLLISTP